MKEYTDNDFNFRLPNNNSILNAKKREATRDIEIYVAQADHTWFTTSIKIPLSTPEDEIEKVAIDRAKSLFSNNPHTFDEVAFVGIYNIPYAEGA